MLTLQLVEIEEEFKTGRQGQKEWNENIQIVMMTPKMYFLYKIKKEKEKRINKDEQRMQRRATTTTKHTKFALLLIDL